MFTYLFPYIQITVTLAHLLRYGSSVVEYLFIPMPYWLILPWRSETSKTAGGKMASAVNQLAAKPLNSRGPNTQILNNNH